MTLNAPLALHDICRVYNEERKEIAVRAVDHVSFELERGESVAIIGPSGCGKSTLLNVIGCLDRATSGTYLLEGRTIADRTENELAALRNRHIGFVFQTFNLLPRMNALENVELPLLYAATKGSKEKARRALERVGLADRAHHLPGELSGGQKQRVAIARAIVTEPSVILCDEPTGALDSQTGREVLELLLRLNAEGSTLLMVTHDLSLAAAMRRVLQMSDGRIVADGPAREIVDAFVATLTPLAAADTKGGPDAAP